MNRLFNLYLLVLMHISIVQILCFVRCIYMLGLTFKYFKIRVFSEFSVTSGGNNFWRVWNRV